ncbi:MAG: hypothetical protein Q9187_003419 [Circinaria calcarea]
MPTLQFSEGPEPPKPLPHRKQLLNHMVDGMAQVRPESVWAKIPWDDLSYNAGYRKITYRLFANAVNGVAWWLLRELGQSERFDTLAYFGTWDPRYIILLLGAVKVGYKMVFPSSNYGFVGLVSLLDGLNCTTVLTASKELPSIGRLLKESRLAVHEIPSLRELLDKNYPHFPFDKTFQAARLEPLVVVHTSGSTGFPKPLIYTHDWAASWIQQNQWQPPEGYMSVEHLCHGIEVCAIVPPNHGSGFFPNLFGAVANQMVVLYPLPDAPLTLGTTMAMVEQNNPDLLISPPHVLDGLALDPKLLQEVSSKVTMIGFGGGPLSKETGRILSQYFRLFSIYGTSEMGIVHKIVPNGVWDNQGWNSVQAHPKDNIEFRQLQSSDYEAVLLRNPEFEEEQPVFKLFPEVREWSTKDIFSPDTNREGFWIYQGRVDDLIILNNGMTVNPVGYEQKISSSPLVAGAFMHGTGRPQVALVIELLAPQESLNLKNESFAERLWPAISECNELFPPQASVDKSHIIFTPPGKPLPRSGKGTVQRAPAMELFSEELNALYEYI